MSLPVTLNTSECFDDVIALRGACTTVTPTSGLYLDQFGVNLNELNQYIGSEYAKGEDLYEDKKQFAVDLIANIILTALHPKLKGASLIDGHRIGFFNDSLDSVSGDATYNSGGINIRINNTTSYVQMMISEITVHLNYTGEVNLYLADLRQNKILQSFQIQSVAGEYGTIYPQYKIESPRQITDLFLFRDTNGKPSYRTNVNDTNCVSCYPTNRNGMVSATAAMMNGGVPIIRSNMQGANNTAGISIVYSLGCNHRSWLCSFSNLLAVPLGYKIAAEIVDYGMNNSTDRISTAKIVDRNVMEKRKAEYEFKFREALDNVLKNIRYTDNVCFECNRSVANLISLP